MDTKSPQSQPHPFISLFFPTRIGRLSYFGRLLLLAALGFGILYLIHELVTDTKGRAWLWLYVAWNIVFLFYLFAFIVLPRLRDIEAPLLLIILSFIPMLNGFFGLCLLFAPTGYWKKLQNKMQKPQ